MIIYKATNLINKKCYIGKSEYSIEKRINEHYNRKSNSYFHHSLKKYGKDNFEWSIIKECDNVPLLNILETFMIMVHHTFVDEGGYNLTWGGEGCSGLIHTEETKKKISETHKGNTYWLGKHHTEESKKKISNNKIGTVITEEARQKISKANTGKKRTEESKKKMSESMKGNQNSSGYIQTEEHKRKISNSLRGKTHTEEHKRKISESLKRKRG